MLPHRLFILDFGKDVSVMAPPNLDRFGRNAAVSDGPQCNITKMGESPHGFCQKVARNVMFCQHTNATFHVVALLRGFWPFVKKQDVNQFADAYARITLQFLHRGVAGPQNDKFDVIS